MNNTTVKAALILEGGALRSVYTAGVLDVFMENNIYFEYVIGVSAGALIGTNYISKQPGRSILFNIEHRNDPRYIGLKHWLFEGSIFNFDFLFGKDGNKLMQFNFEMLNNTNQRFLVEATNCFTGKSEYFERYDYNALTEALRASSSLPFLTRISHVNGVPYIDGGISNTVPIEKAVADGYNKIIIILTRKKGYRRKDNLALKIIYSLYYKKYPNIVQLMRNSPQRYNSKRELLDQLEQEKKIIIIRPKSSLNVGIIEHSKEKLQSFYSEGKEDGRNSLSAIIKYIDDE